MLIATTSANELKTCVCSLSPSSSQTHIFMQVCVCVLATYAISMSVNYMLERLQHQTVPALLKSYKAYYTLHP